MSAEEDVSFEIEFDIADLQDSRPAKRKRQCVHHLVDPRETGNEDPEIGRLLKELDKPLADARKDITVAAAAPRAGRVVRKGELSSPLTENGCFSETKQARGYTEASETGEKGRPVPFVGLLGDAAIGLSAAVLVLAAAITFRPDYAQSTTDDYSIGPIVESMNAAASEYSPRKDAKTVRFGGQLENSSFSASVVFMVQPDGDYFSLSLSTPSPRSLTPLEIVEGKSKPPWLAKVAVDNLKLNRKDNLLQGDGIAKAYIEHLGMRQRLLGKAAVTAVFDPDARRLKARIIFGPPDGWPSVDGTVHVSLGEDGGYDYGGVLSVTASEAL